MVYGVVVLFYLERTRSLWTWERTPLYVKSLEHNWNCWNTFRGILPEILLIHCKIHHRPTIGRLVDLLNFYLYGPYLHTLALAYTRCFRFSLSSQPAFIRSIITLFFLQIVCSYHSVLILNSFLQSCCSLVHGCFPQISSTSPHSQHGCCNVNQCWILATFPWLLPQFQV